MEMIAKDWFLLLEPASSILFNLNVLQCKDVISHVHGVTRGESMYFKTIIYPVPSIFHLPTSFTSSFYHLSSTVSIIPVAIKGACLSPPPPLAQNIFPPSAWVGPTSFTYWLASLLFSPLVQPRFSLAQLIHLSSPDFLRMAYSSPWWCGQYAPVKHWSTQSTERYIPEGSHLQIWIGQMQVWQGCTVVWLSVLLLPQQIVVIIIISCHRFSFFPGTSPLEPVVNPTTEASSLSL
jgi:hypothetical protein